MAMGPKIGTNPDGYPLHVLVRHGSRILEDVPRTFEELRELLRHLVCEGIVFHHPDGRMAKVKTRDFGLEWPRR